MSMKNDQENCTCLEVFGEDPRCPLHGGPLRLAVYETFGGRCDVFDPECETCQAWAEIDRVASLSSPAPEAAGVGALLDEIYRDPDYVGGGQPERDDEGLLYPFSPYDRGRYDARKIVRKALSAIEPTQAPHPTPAGRAALEAQDA